MHLSESNRIIFIHILPRFTYLLRKPFFNFLIALCDMNIHESIIKGKKDRKREAERDLFICLQQLFQEFIYKH